jgi:hypothetical protein
MTPDEAEMNKIVGYDISCITGASKSRGSDFINTFDIQCHENSKVHVELFTAPTVEQNGVTVHLKKTYSRPRRTTSKQYIDKEWRHTDVPKTLISDKQLNGNSCVLLSDTDLGYQRWNTSVEIEFRDCKGLVLQSAVVNIDKLPSDKWEEMDIHITNEYSCVICPQDYGLDYDVLAVYGIYPNSN